MTVAFYKKISVLAFLLTTLCEAQSQSPTYTRLDSEALAKKSQQIIKSQTEPSSTKTVTPTESQNLLAESTLIAANGNWTFVPKDSVIHIPRAYSKNIVDAPNGTFLPFPQFQRKNYGWLVSRELSMEELIGDKKLKKSVTEAIISSHRMVVATNNKTPISTEISKIQKETTPAK